MYKSRPVSVKDLKMTATDLVRLIERLKSGQCGTF